MARSVIPGTWKMPKSIQTRMSEANSRLASSSHRVFWCWTAWNASVSFAGLGDATE